MSVSSTDGSTASGPVERVHLISLGCPKNRVDSEVMVGKLQRGPFELVDEPELRRDCRQYLQLHRARDAGVDRHGARDGSVQGRWRLQKLLVTGCMVQRYGRALESELPEVDFFLGTGEYHRIDEVLRSRAAQGPRSFVDTPLYIHDELAPRVNSWRPHSAYLKISEGCNHRCSFCIIPTLRGRLRSRGIASLTTEARALVEQGVREINLVSQDRPPRADLGDGSDPGGLLRSLATIDDLSWIRLHYAYPIGLPDSLLRAIAEEERWCRISIYHSNMRRVGCSRRCGVV